jgi:hypothetical protein
VSDFADLIHGGSGGDQKNHGEGAREPKLNLHGTAWSQTSDWNDELSRRIDFTAECVFSDRHFHNGARKLAVVAWSSFYELSDDYDVVRIRRFNQQVHSESRRLPYQVPFSSCAGGRAYAGSISQQTIEQEPAEGLRGCRGKFSSLFSLEHLHHAGQPAGGHREVRFALQKRLNTPVQFQLISTNLAGIEVPFTPRPLKFVRVMQQAHQEIILKVTFGVHMPP